MTSRPIRCASRGLVAVAAIYLVLLVPERDPPLPRTADGGPFLWDRDAFWASLEARFGEARAEGCTAVAARIDALLDATNPELDRLATEPLAPGDPALESLETNFFELAPLVAACPDRLPDYLSAIARLRQGVKRQSEAWDVRTTPARRAVYRILYGSRAALEEVLLQAPPSTAPEVLVGSDEPSAAPILEIRGVRLRSGDVLLSRGGAPTSALIARAQDLPGNFSHVALLHVDEATGAGTVIEAHSESGVSDRPFEEYLREVKLRILALRPRADLPELARDPLLPHRAAGEALRRARERHIPYDFAMAGSEHSAQFCSEVAAAAYEEFGIELWPGPSTISDPGAAAWLAAFGVRHFTFEEPSDLEYDAQLRVVAEWRDPETLFQDHLDNAVVDARLEQAEEGRGPDYDRAMLPIGRLLKGWSLILNAFGRVGPVPEGMSATAALRARRFEQDHAAIRGRLLARAIAFERERGYRAPYPELLRFAREALAESP